MGESRAAERQLLKGTVATLRWGTRWLGGRAVPGFSLQHSPGELESRPV